MIRAPSGRRQDSTRGAQLTAYKDLISSVDPPLEEDTNVPFAILPVRVVGESKPPSLVPNHARQELTSVAPLSVIVMVTVIAIEVAKSMQ